MFMGLDDDFTGFEGGGGGASFEVDDTDLENELLMLLGDGNSNRRSTGQKPKAKPRAFGNSNFDVDLGDEAHHGDSGDDEDGDLDDPELHVINEIPLFFVHDVCIVNIVTIPNYVGGIRRNPWGANNNTP